jgi:hypothetical protein
VPVTGDDVVIGPTPQGNNPANYDLGAGVQLHSITLNVSQTYTFTGGAIGLQTGGSITDNNTNAVGAAGFNAALP